MVFIRSLVSFGEYTRASSICDRGASWLDPFFTSIITEEEGTYLIVFLSLVFWKTSWGVHRSNAIPSDSLFRKVASYKFWTPIRTSTHCNQTLNFSEKNIWEDKFSMKWKIICTSNVYFITLGSLISTMSITSKPTSTSSLDTEVSFLGTNSFLYCPLWKFINLQSLSSLPSLQSFLSLHLLLRDMQSLFQQVNWILGLHLKSEENW